MKKRIFSFVIGLLLISINAFADGNCNLVGSSLSGGINLYNVLLGSGTDDSPYVFANTGRKIYFGTNGNITTPSMIIDTSGNVGIGTTTPAAKLDVEGTGNVILNAGNVGIGTTTPAQKLSVAGTIESTSGGIKFPDGTTQTTASKVVQVVNYTSGATAINTSSSIPRDDTTPQSTEGAEWATLSITPKSAQDKLLIEVILQGTMRAEYKVFVAALFKDSDVNAIEAGNLNGYSYGTGCLVLRHFMDAGTTNTITFKVRYSGVINENNYGGASASSITITELAP